MPELLASQLFEKSLFIFLLQH